jgi:alpha-amylase
VWCGCGTATNVFLFFSQQQQMFSFFGTKSELKKLIDAAHARNILIMLDIVANHVGPIGFDFHEISPFNDAKYYHSCQNCPKNCMIVNYTCNTDQILECRLDTLPDLDQSQPQTASWLFQFIEHAVRKLGVDGLRIDSTIMVILIARNGIVLRIDTIS